MAIRCAMILFTGLTCILQVVGPPNAHILLAGTAGILQVAGPPASHKASNIDADAPLVDQLLESLSVAGYSRIGRLSRAALKRPTEIPGLNGPSFAFRQQFCKQTQGVVSI